jgi:hypothetical protein
MSKSEKPKVEDILQNLEDKPPAKPSKLTAVYNAASGAGDLVANIAKGFAWAGEKLYAGYHLPGVKETLLWPYDKDTSTTGKAIGVGVLAAGIGAAYFSWGWTLFGSKLLASAAVAKGTQFGVAFGTKLIFNESAADTASIVPQKKSEADAEIGELPEAPKVKATSRKADRNEM